MSKKRTNEEDILYKNAKASYYDWMENPESEFYRYRANLTWRRYRTFCFMHRLTPKDI